MLSPHRVAERPYWWVDSVQEALWQHRNVRIPATALVLDVGSGGSPHPRANVLCDRAPEDGTERHGELIRLDRPFVAGDVQALPFADNSFDYVICSHVLEHVQDPVTAAAELSRVAPAGYIETPGADWEKLAGYRFHRWLVRREDAGLVFSAKRASLEDPELQQFFLEMTGRLGISAYIWLRRRRADVYTTLAWTRPLRVSVVGSPPEDVDSAQDGAGRTVSPRPAPGALERLLTIGNNRARRRTQPDETAVDRLLRCPDCYSALTRGSGHDRRCDGCGREFPAGASPFPILLPSR